MNRKTIRFDIRVPFAEKVDESSFEGASSRFSLRPDVRWQLSVDPWVWPSVFYSRPRSDPSQPGFIEVPLETDDGMYWLNLQEMTRYFALHKRPSDAGITVAIDIWWEHPLDDETISYKSSDGVTSALPIPQAKPSSSEIAAELLGFDVADASGISGLTNCAFKAEILDKLRTGWHGRINEHGLLSTIDAAVEFRELTNNRVSEHAPFWIFSLERLL